MTKVLLCLVVTLFTSPVFAEGGMIIGGPENGTIMPGSEGGMVIGGPMNGSILPPSR